MNLVGDQNYNNNNIYNNSVNRIIEIKNQLYQNQLPPHCNLMNNDLPFDHYKTMTAIRFTNPHSNYKGFVIIGHPEFMPLKYAVPIVNGYIHIMCYINKYAGLVIMQVTVYSLAEMIDVIAFFQNILEYQLEQHNMGYLRIPQHLLNHWCIPPYLRDRNVRANNIEIGINNENNNIDVNE
jgi:hypothetical protein